MNEQTLRTAPGTRQWTILAVLGLVIVLASPFLYFLLIDIPSIRSTAWPTFVVMVDGIAIGVLAVTRDRRWRNRGLLIASTLLSATFALMFFIGGRLPAATMSEELATAPDFTLPDPGGKPVALSDALARGPVLLVFYRGHW